MPMRIHCDFSSKKRLLMSKHRGTRPPSLSEEGDEEKRADADGGHYTKTEFKSYYGSLLGAFRAAAHTSPCYY